MAVVLAGLVGCRMQMRGALDRGDNAGRLLYERPPGRCSVVTDDDTDKPWRDYRSAGAVACLNRSSADLPRAWVKWRPPGLCPLAWVTQSTAVAIARTETSKGSPDQY